MRAHSAIHSMLWLALAGCTDRAIHDDAGLRGDDDLGGEDDLDPDEAGGVDEAGGGDPGSLEAQGITVLSKYYEGSIMVIELTTHPDFSCARPFPWPEPCSEEVHRAWNASFELVGDRAAPGSYGEADLSFWDVSHIEFLLDSCARFYTPTNESPVADLVLTVEQGGPDGVRGRIDGLEVFVPRVSTISGSFDALPCE